MVSTSSPVAATEAARDPLDEVVKPVEIVDYCAIDDEISEAVETAAEESAAELGDAPVKRVYFIRVPRPPMDESSAGHLKKLQDNFQAQVAKIKKLNGKLATKRDEVRELRKQMSQARSLKGESQPEFEEKLNRLKQLKDLRKGYQDKISDIKTVLKGLECKSEEELDAKIKDMEHRIAHDQLQLREEKQFVKLIGVLGSQREKIKEYDAQKGSLSEMEGECTKIKAVINEMDGEFSILKGERDSAQKIMSDIYAKLQVAEKALKEAEEEQAEAVRVKNEALEMLDNARDTQNADMKDYRANRKFSMQVRDLVAVGQVEEASALCQLQVEEWSERLGADAAFRDSYIKLWAEQRKYAVSELLPESSAAVMETLAAASKAAAKGGKGGKGGEKPKPVANGAEKARLLIESLMQEASKEAQERNQERARQRAAEPRAHDDEEEHDADVEDEPVVLTPGEIVTAAAEAAIKKAQQSRKEPALLVTNANAKAAEVFGNKVELPVVADTPEFVLPVTSTSNEVEQVSKDQIREEQQRKAKEAEERKKKRQEQAEEKRIKGAERQRQLEADAKAAEAKAAAAKVAAQRQAAAEAEAAARKTEAEAETAEAVASKPSAANALLKSTAVAAAKRPANKGLEKKLRKMWAQNQMMIVAAAVILIVILLLVSLM